MAFALDARGGGQALPSYLQARTPTLAGAFATRPVITPKSTVVPGEAVGAAPKPNVAGLLPQPPITPNIQKPMQPLVAGGGSGALPPMNILPQANIPGLNQNPTTPGAAGATGDKPSIQTLFEFMKQDLENERNRALGSTQASAAKRGVYYGSPLTTSEGDINTSYLRGLGQLQADMLQNEQQNELARLGLATNLIGQPASYGELAGTGAANPEVYSTIGSLFGGGATPTAPAITPNPMAKPPTGMVPGSGIQPKGITPPTTPLQPTLTPQVVAPALQPQISPGPTQVPTPNIAPLIQPPAPGLPLTPNVIPGVNPKSQPGVNPLIALLRSKTLV